MMNYFVLFGRLVFISVPFVILIALILAKKGE